MNKRRFYICLEFDYDDSKQYLSHRAEDCLKEFIKDLHGANGPEFVISYFKESKFLAHSLMTFDDEKPYEETHNQIMAAMVRHCENS